MSRAIEALSEAIVAHNVRHVYGERVAVDDLSFDVPNGAMFGLLGPNGSGKSTLFRLLATLLPLQQGRMTVAGCDVAQERDRVRQQISVTFQSPALDPRLTVAENLWCHGRLFGLETGDIRQRSSDLLNDFRLGDRARELVSSLSGGLRRRVELAKCLLSNPRVLLLDEPTSGLDPISRHEFQDILRARQKSHGTTVVIATHLMDEAEGCDQLLLLDRGRRIAAGTPDELRSLVSGERIAIRVRQPDVVAGRIGELLQTSVQRRGERLAARVPQAAPLVALLMSQPELGVLSVEVSPPSLDDVFLEITGGSLVSEGASSG